MVREEKRARDLRGVNALNVRFEPPDGSEPERRWPPGKAIPAEYQKKNPRPSAISAPLRFIPTPPPYRFKSRIDSNTAR